MWPLVPVISHETHQRRGLETPGRRVHLVSVLILRRRALINQTTTDRAQHGVLKRPEGEHL